MTPISPTPSDALVQDSQQSSSQQSRPATELSASPNCPDRADSPTDILEDLIFPDPVANLEQLRCSQAFINALRNASLDNSQLKPDDLHRLRNPPKESINLSEDPDL
ncbi:hypothetical protein L208DRAFT_1404774 [Tricholoma matsutake]|nr:hypothetical protein L208DRAFT_1404774 [Tricholoma matsutake 945]